MNFFIVLLLSCISSCLYRAGGRAKGDDPQWLPEFMHGTLWRDIGCSLVSCLLVGYLISWDWTLILCFGLSWGAMSTYWKVGPKAYWFHWLITGTMYSVATVPFIIAEGHWLGFASRTIVLGASTMIWSELNNNAIWEECGRGALITLTIPLILI